MTDARRVQTASTTLTPENSTPEGGERGRGEREGGKGESILYNICCEASTCLASKPGFLQFRPNYIGFMQEFDKGVYIYI